MAALRMDEGAPLTPREGGEGVENTERPDTPRGVLTRPWARADTSRRAPRKGVAPPSLGARTAAAEKGVGGAARAGTGATASEEAPAPDGAEAGEMATPPWLEADVRPVLNDGVGSRAETVGGTSGVIGADIDRDPMADQDHERAETTRFGLPRVPHRRTRSGVEEDNLRSGGAGVHARPYIEVVFRGAVRRAARAPRSIAPVWPVGGP